MGDRIIININRISICYLFFINSITRRKVTFKRHKKRWLFNICFFIEGGSIQIKEGSNNMNCMRKLFIMVNFIKKNQRPRNIERENKRRCWVRSMLHLLFPATKSFVQILPKLKWILNKIYEMIYIWRNSQTHNSISSITIIYPINILFIRNLEKENKRRCQVRSMLHLQFPANQNICPKFSKAQMDTQQNL